MQAPAAGDGGDGRPTGRGTGAGRAEAEGVPSGMAGPGSPAPDGRPATRYALWRVFLKEFRENLRDRRSLITALVIGPLLMPALVAAALSIAIHHGREQTQRPVPVTVVHAGRAPHLLAFLRQYRVLAVPVEARAPAARRLAATLHRPLLYVPRDFGARLAAGRPAALRLYADESDRTEQQAAGRVTRLIGLYAGVITRLRLVARGLDPLLLTPIVVHPIDISTPQSRSVLVLGMLSYVILLAMLMGGMYMAIDATAGERERGSLEPLLTVPVEREHLVYGKMLAASAMMLLTLTLTVSAFAVTLRHIGLDRMGMSVNFGAGVVAAIVLYSLPLIPLGAALMTLVASFTRSYREAQTYIGLILLIPTVPLMFAGLLGLRPSLMLMTVPFLSQHFLIMSLLRAQPLPAFYAVTSAGVTLLPTGVLVWLAGRLYRREKLLG